MKRSAFDLLLGGPAGLVLFNTLAGRGLRLAPVQLARLRHASAGPPRDHAWTACLAASGSLVPDDVDERAWLRAALNTGPAAREADITYVLSPHEALEHLPPALEAAFEQVTQWVRERGVERLKLRLCPAPDSDVEARRAWLAGTRERAVRACGVPVVTLWMAAELSECVALHGDEADAFFVRWDLGAPAHTDEDACFARLASWVRAGLPLALQVALHSLADLEPATRLRAAAQQTALRSPGCQWDVALAGTAGPFFLPSVCQEQADDTRQTLALARARLQSAGLAPRPAIAPRHRHVACPAERAFTLLVDVTGRRSWCPHAQAPSVTPPGRARDTLSERCLACAHAPFCLAQCPRAAGHGRPASGRCRAQRSAIERELLRLVASGQLDLAPMPEPAPGVRP